jgi:hypothetical protein
VAINAEQLIEFGIARVVELEKNAFTVELEKAVGGVTFPFIPLFDLLFDKNSSGNWRSDWRRRLRDRSKPLAFESVRAIFIFADPRGEHEPALQNFHANEMAM